MYPSYLIIVFFHSLFVGISSDLCLPYSTLQYLTNDLDGNDINIFILKIHYLLQANGYLVQKWKLWFDLNDINGDGMLSLDDTKLFE
jgi:hypothetical protein